MLFKLSTPMIRSPARSGRSSRETMPWVMSSGSSTKDLTPRLARMSVSNRGCWLLMTIALMVQGRLLMKSQNSILNVFLFYTDWKNRAWEQRIFKVFRKQ